MNSARFRLRAVGFQINQGGLLSRGGFSSKVEVGSPGSAASISPGHTTPDATQAETPTRPLDRAIEAWVSHLSPSVRLRVERGMRAAASRDVLTFATVFSGTDIVTRIISRLYKRFHQFVPGDRVSWVALYQCELDPDKRVWLGEQFPECEMLFVDAAHLSKPKAFNTKSQTHESVPQAEILIAGFVCKSRARCNSARSANKGCVAGGTGETGMTFGFIMDLIHAKKPALVILENVTGLEEATGTGPDEDASDATYVVGALEEAGFSAQSLTVKAQDYSSKTNRTRLYFVGFHGRNQKAKFSFMTSVLAEARLGPNFFDISEFLVSDAFYKEVMQDETKAGGNNRQEPKYETEHSDVFATQSWPWPLSERTFTAEFGTAMLHLNQRPRELVYIAHKLHPMPLTTNVPLLSLVVSSLGPGFCTPPKSADRVSKLDTPWGATNVHGLW